MVQGSALIPFYNTPKPKAIGWPNNFESNLKPWWKLLVAYDLRLIRSLQVLLSIHVGRVVTKEVVREEIKALKTNKSWEYMGLPRGKKIVGCKWVSSVKYNVDGSAFTSIGYQKRILEQGTQRGVRMCHQDRNQVVTEASQQLDYRSEYLNCRSSICQNNLAAGLLQSTAGLQSAAKTTLLPVFFNCCRSSSTAAGL
ncbi:hypothetical protein OSB04_023596 [Centaurea solstitialis]|uniref:Uncharacterized protein n=1 Tax=Centaurea solstitialis TaxID=347529 RepID=A0AA38WB88_9ASTR|nr:hypothetical protein OSB04_023596 [Centaurea solstitialis]